MEPTSLLCLNLPGMSTAIRAHQITLQNPRGGSIGKQADGQWATGALKEYLPAFNRALASQFCDSICGIPFVESEDPDESFLTVCTAVTVTSFSTKLGRDYAG